MNNGSYIASTRAHVIKCAGKVESPTPAKTRLHGARAGVGLDCVSTVTVAKPLPNLETGALRPARRKMPPSEAEYRFRKQDAGLFGLEGRHFVMFGGATSGACGRTIMVKDASISSWYADKEWKWSVTITPKDAHGGEYGEEFLSREEWRKLVAGGKIREVAWPPKSGEPLTTLW